MFALGAKWSTNETHYLQLGADIANTCHESYIRSGKRRPHCFYTAVIDNMSFCIEKVPFIIYVKVFMLEMKYCLQLCFGSGIINYALEMSIEIQTIVRTAYSYGR